MEDKLKICIDHFRILVDTSKLSASLNPDQLFSVRPGPLLRSTDNGSPTHMPISSTAFSKAIVKRWKAAELELNGSVSLNLTSHSARRGVVFHLREIVARMIEVPVALGEELIDSHFRWSPTEGRMRKRYTGHLSRKLRLLVSRFL